MKPVKLEGFRTVRQIEDHTCGYCAMCAVYRYYGLDTRKLRLRERLGTDNRFFENVLLAALCDKLEAQLEKKGKDTKGTLPMDLFAVLYGDGFEFDWKTGRYVEYREDLYRHLKSGHPALLLADGINHWVVVTGMDDGGVSVLDSSSYLDPDGRGRHRYRLTHERFESVASGVVLVKRGKRAGVREMTAADFAREYTTGAVFGAKCLGLPLPSCITRRMRG